MGIGTEFTEQTSTTDLDRARERYVEEQLQRIRRGEEPTAPFPKKEGSAVGLGNASDRFVGEEKPAEANASHWISASRQVPEVDLGGPEAKAQYEETARVMALAKEQERLRATPLPMNPPERIVHNYNALAFQRPRQPKRSDWQARKDFIEHNKRKF